MISLPHKLSKYLWLLLLISLPGFNGFSQFLHKPYPLKKSPWTAVKWQENKPFIRVDDQWYELKAVNNIIADSLVMTSQRLYNIFWREEFCFNISNILRVNGVNLKNDAILKVQDSSSSQIIILQNIPFTSNNWLQASYYQDVIGKRIHRAHSDTNTTIFEFIPLRYYPKEIRIDTPIFKSDFDKYKFLVNDHDGERFNRLPHYLTRKQAEEDLDQLEWYLVNKYAYLDHQNVNYQSAIDMIRSHLGEKIGRTDFAHQIQKVLGLFGDGHAKVTFADSRINLYKPNIRLPFYVIDHNNRLAAFNYYPAGLVNNNYPYIKSINNIPIERWLSLAMEMRSAGTIPYKRLKGIRWFNRFDYLKRCMGIKGDSIVLELESRDMNSSVSIPMKLQKRSIVSYRIRYPKSQVFEENIGYLRIPRMNKDETFLDEIVSKMNSFKDTDGLIIDIRDNSGGRRGVLKKLFPFFMDSTDMSYVANIGALRINEEDDIHHPKGYLYKRYMYPADSDKWSKKEREAIAEFSASFEPKWEIPEGQRSVYHYLVISPKLHKSKYYFYDKPVIILMNERCFSSAETFLEAFQGWRNITIMGAPSSGGSGNPATFWLFHSLITFKIPSMVSYKRNGELFNGNSIIPDIIHHSTLMDKIGKTDTMLKKAKNILTGSK